MSREIMQQALDALQIYSTASHKIQDAIKALKAELAKPKQEPKLTDAGADTNIDPFTLYPKGSGMVTLHEPEQDWSLLQATQESLREHQARIKELEAQLAPRQLLKLRQEAWKSVRDVYRDDPEVCFAMGFDAGYGAVASRVEPPQGECNGFDSLPAPLSQPRKEWVGLTSEDWENTPDTGKQGCERDAELFDWIEQTLKDKNEPNR